MTLARRTKVLDRSLSGSGAGVLPAGVRAVLVGAAD